MTPEGEKKRERERKKEGHLEVFKVTKLTFVLFRFGWPGYMDIHISIDREIDAIASFFVFYTNASGSIK